VRRIYENGNALQTSEGALRETIAGGTQFAVTAEFERPWEAGDHGVLLPTQVEGFGPRASHILPRLAKVENGNIV
jgi:hypothetical protein